MEQVIANYGAHFENIYDRLINDKKRNFGILTIYKDLWNIKKAIL